MSEILKWRKETSKLDYRLDRLIHFLNPPKKIKRATSWRTPNFWNCSRCQLQKPMDFPCLEWLQGHIAFQEHPWRCSRFDPNQADPQSSRIMMSSFIMLQMGRYCCIVSTCFLDILFSGVLIEAWFLQEKFISFQVHWIHHGGMEIQDFQLEVFSYRFPGGGTDQ